MSYILDALNKSEQERRGQQTPDLQTVHRAPPVKTQSRLPLIIIALLITINVGGLGYWLMSSDSKTNQAVGGQTAPASTPSPATTLATTPNTDATTTSAQTTMPDVTRPVTSIDTAAADVSSPSSSGINQTEGTLITPDAAFARPKDQAVRITELPLNVQRQIPDLIFSSHLYSDEPDFRMVNINSKMIREGDMVATDLRLLEISEEGVVLGFRHYVFEVSVLRDWSFN